MGFRVGDNAPMAFVEIQPPPMVDRPFFGDRILGSASAFLGLRAHPVPISCPRRAHGFGQKVEMTIGLCALAPTIGSKSRPLGKRTNGRGHH
jgi:hypothetical protein